MSAKRGAAGARSAARERGLDDEMRDFAAARPAGWDHGDWLGFLDHLRSRGYDVSDEAAVGTRLEGERLAQRLRQVPGVGPQRVRALAERFGTLWALQRAEVDEIAAIPSIPRALAERIASEVR